MVYTENRLINIYIGVTDVTPVPLTEMLPEELQLTLCVFIEPPLDPSEVRRVECPPGGVTGRYLVIQLNTNSALSLCEVTAEKLEGRICNIST